MARLYTNENFPRPAVEELRRLGHDVLTTHDAGKSNQGISDEDVVVFATAQERAVVTLNRRDFMQIHRARPKHGGIVVCTVDTDFLALAVRVDRAICSQSSITNQLVRVDRGQSVAAKPGPISGDAVLPPRGPGC